MAKVGSEDSKVASNPLGPEGFSNEVAPQPHEATAQGCTKEEIRASRGAFKWLPVYCSNDLVHGKVTLACYVAP